MRRYRDIPPLQYLLGFEAAARLGSFALAAAELGLTQSAISHQIRLLEDRLGQPLFIRTGRGITLNDAGRDYWMTVSKSFDALNNGYKRLAPYIKPGSVIIYCPRDFGALWFMPRLADLRRAIPQCDPWLDTTGKMVDFNEITVDIAIVRAQAPDERFLTFALASDHLTPVLAPALLPSPCETPADLLRVPLLHDERPESWSDWFRALDIEAGDLSAGTDFSDPDLALKAAEMGLGAALASRALIEDRLSSGALVAPFATDLDTGHSWYARTRPQDLEDPMVAVLWHWLQGQADVAR